jgi:ATP-dependent RNA helicase DHX8/PRP22
MQNLVDEKILSVYNSWKESEFSEAWCSENFVQINKMKRAQDVRNHLLHIMSTVDS